MLAKTGGFKPHKMKSATKNNGKEDKKIIVLELRSKPARKTEHPLPGEIDSPVLIARCNISNQKHFLWRLIHKSVILNYFVRLKTSP